MSEQFNVSNLEKGIYIAQVATNKSIYPLKLIKR
ncbi:T9SS type A sorting domain-containing protein [Bacteroidales bacterium OttesenSCG-928-I14]|nr:T9SS type A sorting domain-containing protein [Bacteroidales bacterium OttesenSCG-928-I14]